MAKLKPLAFRASFLPYFLNALPTELRDEDGSSRFRTHCSSLGICICLTSGGCAVQLRLLLLVSPDRAGLTAVGIEPATFGLLVHRLTN